MEKKKVYVYIVEESEWEEDRVLGIFTDLSKALKVAKKGKTPRSIIKMEVNKEYTSEEFDLLPPLWARRDYIES